MEWQPIETAPKDGTEVLLYRRTLSEWSVWEHHYKTGYYDLRDRWGWWTHWTPLNPPNTP